MTPSTRELDREGVHIDRQETFERLCSGLAVMLGGEEGKVRGSRRGEGRGEE